MNDLTIYRKQAGDLDGEHTQVSTALRELDAFEVRSNEDSEFAADLIRDVKAKHKELDERRKEVTQPLNTTVRTINSWFKPALDALEQAERKLKAKVALYVQDCERKAREAIALAAAAETEEEASKALAEAPVIAAMPQGVSMRMAWKWKIVDESKIPAYLCSPDMNKIAAEIRGSLQDTGAPSEIPGVEFWQEPVMTVRK